MSLENRVSVRFKQYSETERAIIARELTIVDGKSFKPLLRSAVLPKTSMDVTKTTNDYVYADVEHWVLKQRLEEQANSVATRDMVDELLTMASEVDLPF
jgi:hypothetical protein